MSFQKFVLKSEVFIENKLCAPSLHFTMAATPANLTHYEGSLDEFKNLVSSTKGLMVVKFGTTTCPPCKRLNQVLPSIAKENDTVPFYIVDVDEKPEFGKEYDISSVPNTKYFKDGAEVASIVGLQIPQIKQAIAANK